MQPSPRHGPRFDGSLPTTLAADVAVRSEWSLRMTGTGREALQLWLAERMYTGTLTIPVVELLHSEPGR